MQKRNLAQKTRWIVPKYIESVQLYNIRDLDYKQILKSDTNRKINVPQIYKIFMGNVKYITSTNTKHHRCLKILDIIDCLCDD